MPATGASVAAHDDLQHGGPPAERLVRQATHHGVPCRPFTTAAAAPPVGLDHPARQHRTIRLNTLPDDFKTKLIEAAERRQIRAGEGSVTHVGVFQESGVGTFILGRPRHLPRDRRAGPDYTVIWEEPVKPDSCHRGVSLRTGIEGVEDRLRGGAERVGGGVLVAGDADGDLLDRA